MIPWYLRELNPRVYLETDRWLTLDFETTNISKGSALEKENRVVLSCCLPPRPRVLNIHHGNIPETAVYVGRGRASKWGNPFVVGEGYERGQACAAHAEWLPRQGDLISKIGELRGKALACFCAPARCHADTLVKLANPPIVEDPSLGLGALKLATRSASVLVAHNAKFELQWLARLGINTDHLLILDTMVAQYVLAGNRRWPLDLDSVGRYWGVGGKDPVIDSLMKGGVCPSDMPRKRLEDRVRLDVETTYQVARKQVAELDRLGLLPVLFTRCIATPVLADIETAGLCLDRDRVYEEYNATLTEIGECEQELSKVAGGRNLRSNNQLAELLYDVLGFEEIKDRRGQPKRNKPNKQQPNGARLTDSDTLEKLKAKTKEQRRFVELRKRWGLLNARLTKSLEFFRHICDERGGRFYASLNQTRTQTHRLASSGRKVVFSDGYEGGVQIQNLANDLKRVFVASRPDHVLFEGDGSGIEFRVAGDLCKDDQARDDIVSGADIHRYTASVILDKPEAEVTKKERSEAKPDTFGPLYGKVSGTKGQVAYFEAFRAKYHQIESTQKSWVSEVLRTKELVTPWGMRFYWPHCRMDPGGYTEGSTQIRNYPIQSFATADIVPIALTYIYWRTKAAGLRARLINTVHDSVVCDIHKDDVEEYTPIVVTSFLDCVYHYLEKVYGYDFNHVPLGVGMNVDRFWSQGPEHKVSYGKNEARSIDF